MSSLIFDCPLLFPVRFAHRLSASLAARERLVESKQQRDAVCFYICLCPKRAGSGVDHPPQQELEGSALNASSPAEVFQIGGF